MRYMIPLKARGKVFVAAQEDSKQSKTNAGFAGASGGTLVAIVASQLPDDSPAKNLLIYLAPSTSILFTLLWGWIQSRIVNYVKDQEAERLIKKAKVKIEEGIANPNISDEHREYLRKRLQEFDAISIDRLKSQIQAISIYTIEDVKNKVEPENLAAKTDVEDTK
jgi:hypothetical protein